MAVHITDRPTAGGVGGAERDVLERSVGEQELALHDRAVGTRMGARARVVETQIGTVRGAIVVIGVGIVGGDGGRLAERGLVVAVFGVGIGVHHHDDVVLAFDVFLEQRVGFLERGDRLGWLETAVVVVACVHAQIDGPPRDVGRQFCGQPGKRAALGDHLETLVSGELVLLQRCAGSGKPDLRAVLHAVPGIGEILHGEAGRRAAKDDRQLDDLALRIALLRHGEVELCRCHRCGIGADHRAPVEQLQLDGLFLVGDGRLEAGPGTRRLAVDQPGEVGRLLVVRAVEPVQRRREDRLPSIGRQHLYGRPAMVEHQRGATGKRGDAPGAAQGGKRLIAVAGRQTRRSGIAPVRIPHARAAVVGAVHGGASQPFGRPGVPAA